MGKVIVARKPERVRLLTGHNVESREEPNCINFYATSGGRVELRQNKLNVENVYEIHGDVTMEVGNISHTGTVIVHGDVQAGFEIQAGGDLIVDGLIESSNIVCGGNLSVTGGHHRMWQRPPGGGGRDGAGSFHQRNHWWWLGATS